MSAGELSEAERAALHATHATRINPSHIDCPLCWPLTEFLQSVLAARTAAADARVAEVEKVLRDYPDALARERETRAEALERAADAWQQGKWADAPRCADRVQERIANAQHVTDWLRARADAERTTPDPAVTTWQAAVDSHEEQQP